MPDHGSLGRGSGTQAGDTLRRFDSVAAGPAFAPVAVDHSGCLAEQGEPEAIVIRQALGTAGRTGVDGVAREARQLLTEIET